MRRHADGGPTDKKPGGGNSNGCGGEVRGELSNGDTATVERANGVD